MICSAGAVRGDSPWYPLILITKPTLDSKHSFCFLALNCSALSLLCFSACNTTRLAAGSAILFLTLVLERLFTKVGSPSESF